MASGGVGAMQVASSLRGNFYRDQRPLVSKTVYQNMQTKRYAIFRVSDGRFSATQDWPGANSYSTDATYTRQRNNKLTTNSTKTQNLFPSTHGRRFVLWLGYFPPPRDVICMSQPLDENKALKRNLLDEWFLHKSPASRAWRRI